MLNKKDRHSMIIDGHELVYYRLGIGEPLLLVHGITTYSFIWRNLIPFLESRYELIIVDLLGCGDSDKAIDVEFSLNKHAEVLADLLKALHIQQVHLIGHDVGGGVCQIMSVKSKELVLSLTVINTVAYDFWPVQPIISMRTPIIRQLAMATLDLGAFRFIVKRGIYHTNRLTKALMDQFWYPMKSSAGRKAFLHFAHCLNNRDLLEITDDLHRLEIPVLIIRGERDVYLSSQIANELHRNIKGSKLVSIRTGGHFIQEDEPAMIAECINDFIGQ